MLKTRYTIPPDFAKRYQKSLGIRRGEKDYVIQVRFTPKMADILCDRFLHQSQVWEELPDGGARLTLTLDSLEDITHHVLGWGKDATVDGPPELEQRLYEVGLDFIAKYGRKQQCVQSPAVQPVMQQIEAPSSIEAVIGWGL